MPVRIGVVPSSSPMMSWYVASGPNFTISVSARRITCISVMSCLLSLSYLPLPPEGEGRGEGEIVPLTSHSPHPALSPRGEGNEDLPPPTYLHTSPAPLGRDGHVGVTDAERRQRVIPRVHQRGKRAHRARLAHALGAQRIHLGRHLARIHVEERHVVGAR